MVRRIFDLWLYYDVVLVVLWCVMVGVFTQAAPAIG